MIVSGGTGAGKTTVLNALGALLPDGERIVTVEDTAELRLPGSHVVRLEARPATADGLGATTIRQLVRNALRMRPDRIIVGEVRGAEAVDMLWAMNTGHEGSLSTCHANSPLDALRRLEVMVLSAGLDLPMAAVRDQLSSSLDLVVQVARTGGGRAIDRVGRRGGRSASSRRPRGCGCWPGPTGCTTSRSAPRGLPARAARPGVVHVTRARLAGVVGRGPGPGGDRPRAAGGPRRRHRRACRSAATHGNGCSTPSTG